MTLLLATLLLAHLAQATAPLQMPTPAPAQRPTTIQARQLSVVTSQSVLTAAPGARVALYVDVLPKKDMHVYAPEQTGSYMRIELVLDRTRAFRPGRASYPKASNYYFAPLNETFKVYDKPFRISQTVTIANNAANRRGAVRRAPLAIAGTLRYQACDDEVCYRPEEVRVSWTVEMTPRTPKISRVEFRGNGRRDLSVLAVYR